MRALLTFCLLSLSFFSCGSSYVEKVPVLYGFLSSGEVAPKTAGFLELDFGNVPWSSNGAHYQGLEPEKTTAYLIEPLENSDSKTNANSGYFRLVKRKEFTSSASFLSYFTEASAFPENEEDSYTSKIIQDYLKTPKIEKASGRITAIDESELRALLILYHQEYGFNWAVVVKVETDALNSKEEISNRPREKILSDLRSAVEAISLKKSDHYNYLYRSFY